MLLPKMKLMSPHAIVSTNMHTLSVQPHCGYKSMPGKDCADPVVVFIEAAVADLSGCKATCSSEVDCAAVLYQPANNTCVLKDTNCLKTQLSAAPAGFSLYARPAQTCLCPNNTLANGMASLTDGLALGSNASFTCDAGYKLTGAMGAQCVAVNDTAVDWDQTWPTCQGELALY